MKYPILLLCLSLISLVADGQKFTISGYIKDIRSGESLIGATVLDQHTSSGSVTNTHGFYSLTLSKDSVSLLYSYVGYQRTLLKFFLKKDTTLNIYLDGAMLDEIELLSTRTDAIHENSRMSSFTIPIEQIKAMPALFGETDLLKILQLMPGVQSGYEGSTGLYVRGGGPDQNLILLDGVPVYNASHLFGFFSVFNADAINHVELTKGGFPAHYGGRLSSVIDINMKEGNMKKFKSEGSIGLISSRLTVEGPIQKDRTSFIFSARRTYIDILARPLIRRKSNGAERGYFFYDLNFKLNHIINHKDRLYLSTYAGDDKGYSREQTTYIDSDAKINSKDQFGLNWGNRITAVRWNHIFNPKLFGNITATYSLYRFGVFRKYEESKTSVNLVERLFYGNEYTSGIRDFAGKIDFDYVPNPNHLIKVGANSISHRFSPGVYTYRSTEKEDTTAGAKPMSSYEFALYLEDDWRIFDRLKSNIGLHASGFLVERKYYYSIQPRVSLRFLLTDDFALKASYSSMAQYIHLLTNAGIGLPTDLWVSSTARIAPQRSNQVALGVGKTYQSSYEFSIEGYYKNMSELIEYKDGASYLNIEGDWQDKVATNGRGKSYGAEILVQKKTGVTTGWVGYTLSKSTRQFEQLNFGREFSYKYDRRHDISLAVTHQWKTGKTFSAVWVFGTGNAITLPTAIYEGATNSSDTRYYNDSKIIYYGDRNSYRMKSYHRLDINFSWSKDKKWGQRKWTVGLYNVYNRLNPFFIDLGLDNESNQKFIEYSLFPVLPSVSYTFKFL